MNVTTAAIAKLLVESLLYSQAEEIHEAVLDEVMSLGMSADGLGRVRGAEFRVATALADDLEKALERKRTGRYNA